MVILGTWHIKKNYSYIVMFWGLGICKENVVRKTLLERRCEKDVRKTLDGFLLMFLIDFLCFFSVFNCCWSSGGLNQLQWSTCLFWFSKQVGSQLRDKRTKFLLFTIMVLVNKSELRRIRVMAVSLFTCDIHLSALVSIGDVFWMHCAQRSNNFEC